MNVRIAVRASSRVTAGLGVSSATSSRKAPMPPTGSETVTEKIGSHSVPDGFT